MAQIIDKIVNISINDAVSSVSTTDVNTVALLGTGTGSATLCSSSADAKAFGETSQLYKMVSAFYAQDTQPTEVVAIPLTVSATTTAADITGALESAASVGDFYHVCLSGPVTADVLSSVQAWLAENKKVLHAQVEAADATYMGTLSGKSCDRVAVYKHAEGTSGDEFLNVALVAKRCGTDSARGTFAHKTVKGVSADSYTTTEYTAAVEAGLNIYCKVQGEARVFMGTTCDKSHFIDQKVVDDWIRFNVQSRIYTLLGEANDGAGVTYNDAGITAVAACVSDVLDQAAETGREYIRDDFDVDYKTLDYLKKNNAADVKARNLPLITGSYSRMGAVHTADKVTLNVTL